MTRPPENRRALTAASFEDRRLVIGNGQWMNRNVVIRGPRHSDRRGIILPVALLILGLLAVLAAQVVFRSNADLAAVQAADATLKARWAAEAGLQKVIAVLQGSAAGEGAGTSGADQPRGFANMDAWYDNADAYRGQNVPGEGNPATWRFSIVASDPAAQESDAPAIRYGLTDEASRLNLNSATQDQIVRLIQFVVHNQQVNAEDLAKAILYWRSAIGAGNPQDDTEDGYYSSLNHPYAVKHAPFDSVEELLMVRGMTGQILFGEDWNRNGALDANENDGDASFPPDNSDGQLERGLYPFLTVWSSEPNTNSSNKAKINLNNASAVNLLKSLPAYYTDEEKSAIIRATTGGSLRSPMDLFKDDGTGLSRDLMPQVLDDFTTSKDKLMVGRVNVNTAPPAVLVAVGFTEDEARRLVTARASLSAADKTTTAWLTQQGLLEKDRLNTPDLFQCLTTRAFQFRVESIGFADHVGAFCRLEAVIKMQGRTCQIAYWRDLSSLGLGWPVYGQEGSSAAFGNRE